MAPSPHLHPSLERANRKDPSLPGWDGESRGCGPGWHPPPLPSVMFPGIPSPPHPPTPVLVPVQLLLYLPPVVLSPVGPRALSAHPQYTMGHPQSWQHGRGSRDTGWLLRLQGRRAVVAYRGEGLKAKEKGRSQWGQDIAPHPGYARSVGKGACRVSARGGGHLRWQEGSRK